MLLRNYSDMYPQMALLISIALIVPVSSAPCERGFSTTNRIKTKLHNRLQTSTIDTLLIEGPPISQFDFSRAFDKYIVSFNRFKKIIFIIYNCFQKISLNGIGSQIDYLNFIAS